MAIFLQLCKNTVFGLHAIFFFFASFHQSSIPALPSSIPSPNMSTFSTLIPVISAAKQSSGLPSHDPILYSSFSSLDCVIPGKIGYFFLSFSPISMASLSIHRSILLFKNTGVHKYFPLGI